MSTICVPSEAERELLGELPEGSAVVVWDGTGQAPGSLDAVEFLVGRYGNAPMAAEGLARMPRLRIIQLLSAGVEPWLPVVPEGVVLCNARGVHGASTAELALAGLLCVLRELPRFAAEQAAHNWVRVDTDGLDGKRVLVLGAGDIGARVAAAVEVFDAQATLVARTARGEIRSIGEVPDLLGEHDVVVIALPHSPQTHGLVDAAFLARMPDGATLVNVARGAIVDTDALLAELTARRLHAFLDVTEPEPLPPEHPLWDAPNLVLTPHVGGGTRGWRRRAYQLVRAQFERFVAGEQLVNVVHDGY
ncbi:MAG: NAD(P)-dependent oxidoreductase [Jatrophihabitantaceae bacterium]